MERIENELDEIVKVLEGWESFKVVYKRAFTRSDGLPMLYIRAKSSNYYVHIEGIIKGEDLKCYTKLTENDKNKHSHKDEIIGWDNLYEDRPHIHFNEDEKREYMEEKIRWNEIKIKIREILMEGRG